MKENSEMLSILGDYLEYLLSKKQVSDCHSALSNSFLLLFIQHELNLFGFCCGRRKCSVSRTV